MLAVILLFFTPEKGHFLQIGFSPLWPKSARTHVAEMGKNRCLRMCAKKSANLQLPLRGGHVARVSLLTLAQIILLLHNALPCLDVKNVRLYRGARERACLP